MPRNAQEIVTAVQTRRPTIPMQPVSPFPYPTVKELVSTGWKADSWYENPCGSIHMKHWILSYKQCMRRWFHPDLDRPNLYETGRVSYRCMFRDIKVTPEARLPVIEEAKHQQYTLAALYMDFQSGKITEPESGVQESSRVGELIRMLLCPRWVQGLPEFTAAEKSILLDDRLGRMLVRSDNLHWMEVRAS